MSHVIDFSVTHSSQPQRRDVGGMADVAFPTRMCEQKVSTGKQSSVLHNNVFYVVCLADSQPTTQAMLLVFGPWLYESLL